MKKRHFFKLNKKNISVLRQQANMSQGGYTIIETMVATSLFLVVITVGMSALLNANVVQQKSQDMRSIMDNLSFIIEDMSRNLRTGSQYYCIMDGDSLSDVNQKKSSPNGQNCSGIAFENSVGDPDDSNDQWVYSIDDNFDYNGIWKSTQGPYNNRNNFTKLTSDEIKINPYSSGFYVFGAEPSPTDKQQPFVIIRLDGSITYKDVKTPFSLQTSVSQRLLDF